MDYHSAIKNKYRPLAATRIGVDNIILKEVSQTKTSTMHHYHLCM